MCQRYKKKRINSVLIDEWIRLWSYGVISWMERLLVLGHIKMSTSLVKGNYVFLILN